VEAGALLRCARRQGLRHAGGREGDRRAGARPPADPAARALGAEGERRRRRPRPARHRSGAGNAGGAEPLTPSASPRLAGIAVIAAAGMLAALATGRPAFAALAAPFAVLLGAALAAPSRPQLRVGFGLDVARTLEGSTVSAGLDVHADGPAEWV